MSFSTEIQKKQFKPNIVVQFSGKYFCAFIPDSGLSPDPEYVGTIADLSFDATSVDPQQVTNTISSCRIVLSDLNGVVTDLIGDRGSGIIKQNIDIWLGRITGSFAFSDYKKFSTLQISSIDYGDNTVTIEASPSRHGT